jgi:hypothetical protein
MENSRSAKVDPNDFANGRRLRIAHVAVGLVFLVGFLLTGQYMHRYLGHLQNTPDTERMLYRSTHIYLLWSALLNLALGLYLRLSTVRFRRALQCFGSVMILGGPLLLTFAFFHEPSLSGLLRPLSRPVIYAAFGGLLLHALASISRTTNEPET